MKTNNEKISLKQLEKLIIIQMFSNPLFVIFTPLVKDTNNDGWISIILCGILMIISSFFIAKVCEKFCGQSLVEILEKIFNKPISVIVNIIFLIKYIACCALGLRIFSSVISNILFVNTQIEIIIVIMLAISLLLFIIGYEKRARLSEIIFPVIFIPLILIMLTLFKEVEFSNLLPVFTAPIKNILWQAYVVICIFMSIDTMLFVNIYIKEKKGIFSTMIKAVIKTTSLYIILFIFMIASLTSEEMKEHIWPIIQLLKYVNIPGILIERQELLFVIFWVNSMFFTFSNYIFCQNIIIERIFKVKRGLIIPIILCIVIYFTSLIPSNISVVLDLVNIIQINENYIVLIILPIIIYVISNVKKVGEKT